MKLIEGTYENLITDGLEREMLDASGKGLVCKREDIDSAETPNMLTEHLSRLIRNRLSDENLTAEERHKRKRYSARFARNWQPKSL